MKCVLCGTKLRQDQLRPYHTRDFRGHNLVVLVCVDMYLCVERANDRGRTYAQEDRREAQDERTNESQNEAKGDTYAGTITGDHARDRAPSAASAANTSYARAARVQASCDTDADPRDGDDPRDRAHRAVSNALLNGDAPPASGPHGAQAAPAMTRLVHP